MPNESLVKIWLSKKTKTIKSSVGRGGIESEYQHWGS
jgi:hypothetical protein